MPAPVPDVLLPLVLPEVPEFIDEPVALEPADLLVDFFDLVVDLVIVAPVVVGLFMPFMLDAGVFAPMLPAVAPPAAPDVPPVVPVCANEKVETEARIAAAMIALRMIVSL